MSKKKEKLIKKTTTRDDVKSKVININSRELKDPKE